MCPVVNYSQMRNNQCCISDESCRVHSSSSASQQNEELVVIRAAPRKLHLFKQPGPDNMRVIRRYLDDQALMRERLKLLEKDVLSMELKIRNFLRIYCSIENIFTLL